MKKVKFDKPDYKFWAKKDAWSLHQAALLLHGIDPLKHRALRLTRREIPAEFEEAQKTYILLQSVPWREQHQGYYFYGQGPHPVAIIVEAKKKDLPLPLKLTKFVAQRFDQERKDREEFQKLEKQNEIQASSGQKDIPPQSLPPQEPPLSSRERKNLLKAIGVLVNLLIDEKAKSTRSSRGTKVSALQISQMMLDKAQELEIEIEGLKSFDRKITEALELLKEEVL